MSTALEGQCPFGFGADSGSSTAAAPLDVSDTRGAALAATPLAQAAADAAYPVADWVDPARMMTDPYPTYERLRQESPVAWVPAINKFLVTNYAGCHAVEQDQEIFSANVSGAAMNRALGAQPMLRKDDPEHAADRAPINPVLRPKNIKEAWGTGL